MASGGPGSPASWNRYAYVHGDPVNFKDPKGLLEASGDTNCTVDGNCNSGGGCIDVICIDFGGDDGGDPGPGPAPARPKRPIDVVTDGLARGELSTRLKNFSSTNCNKEFDRVIGGHSLALAGIAGYTEFYNTTNPVFSTDTQNQVSGNCGDTTLETILDPMLRALAATMEQLKVYDRAVHRLSKGGPAEAGHDTRQRENTERCANPEP